MYGILQARVLEWVAMPPIGDFPDPGIEPVSPAAPALQADSSPLIHQGLENPILGILLELLRKGLPLSISLSWGLG